MNKGILVTFVIVGLVILLSSSEEAESSIETLSAQANAQLDHADFEAAEPDEAVPTALAANYSTGLEYNGDTCTVDCSGHEAGAEWAEQNGIDDPDDCGGNSNSFIEGCRTFVEGELGDVENDQDE